MGYHLYRTPLNAGEGRSQDFMTANYFREALLKSRNVECPLRARTDIDVVSRAFRGQPIDEPQTLLREGKG